MPRVGMIECVVLVIRKGVTGRAIVMANINHKAAMAKTEAEPATVSRTESGRDISNLKLELSYY